MSVFVYVYQPYVTRFFVQVVAINGELMYSGEDESYLTYSLSCDHIYSFIDIQIQIFTDIHVCICMYLYISPMYTDALYTKGTRAHTHRELIREWLWKLKGRSLEYI